MPFSKKLAAYPEAVGRILNHAYRHGSVEVPCHSRSPHTLRLYFYSYRRALEEELKNLNPQALHYKALYEANRRFAQLMFQISLDPPPTVRIFRRDSLGTGFLLTALADDLAEEAARVKHGEGLLDALGEVSKDLNTNPRPGDGSSTKDLMEEVVADLFPGRK